MKKGYKQTEDNKKKISLALKGFRHSEETKGKMSLAQKGKTVSEETKSKISLARKGFRHLEESKRKISLSHTGKHLSDDTKKKIGAAVKGTKNPNWNPTLTDEDRQHKRQYTAYHEWRLAVYERDSYTCRKCGNKKSSPLNAHHIEGYSFNKELRTEVENGITLCVPCHKYFHRVYGRRSSIEKVNNFLKETIK